MPSPTRSEIEASLANAFTRFEKDHLGRGPVEVRVYVLDDIVLVRLRGVLTPAEIKLAKTPESHLLIKQVRTQLLECSRTILEELAHRVTGCQILSLHSDISVKTGERVIVFALSQNLEDQYGWRKDERTRR